MWALPFEETFRRFLGFVVLVFGWKIRLDFLLILKVLTQQPAGTFP